MNNRRRLVIALGACASVPEKVFAKAKSKPVLIGWLGFASRGAGRSIAVFKEGLTAAGWKEGTQFTIEERWADGRDDRLAILAQELAAKKPAVIVASNIRAAAVAVKVAPQTPIVFVANNDPVAAGLVTSLARPGGLVTGIAGFGPDRAGKHVELLIAAAPKVKRVGFLVPATGTADHDVILEMARRSAKQYKVEAHFAETTYPEEIDPAIARLAKEGVQGLVLLPFALMAAERPRILKLAAAERWPVVGNNPAFAEEGALLSYGAFVDHRRAAHYVDRILKGTKPGDLPIEQPTTFELVVNMKTAKALGLTMPPEIMVRATRVIQ